MNSLTSNDFIRSIKNKTRSCKSEIPKNLPFDTLEKDSINDYPDFLGNIMSLHKSSKSDLSELKIDMVKILNNIVTKLKEKNENTGKLSRKKKRVLENFLRCKY